MLQTTIQKTTSKGQITLPKAWRMMFKTSQFLIKPKRDALVVRPLFIKENSGSNASAAGYLTIFNADRDNKGRGIPADKLLKILKEIDGES